MFKSKKSMSDLVSSFTSTAREILQTNKSRIEEETRIIQEHEEKRACAEQEVRMAENFIASVEVMVQGRPSEE